MRLGGTVCCEHPAEWENRLVQSGFRAITAPFTCDTPREETERLLRIIEKHNVVIAEVGVWRNTLAADPAERRRWTDYAVAQLRMADAIGAACCVNVVGTPYGPRWDGGYRGNFSQELWQMAVKMIRTIIDAVRPTSTKFCIESMPWMIPSGPDEYVRLIEDVDRPEFGTHLDVVNMITSPRRYFFNEGFLVECFTKLKGTIVSCHLKDIRLKEEYTFQLEECACGEGSLNLPLYARLATEEDPGMPMIIEHLDTDEEYEASVRYVRQELKI